MAKVPVYGDPKARTAAISNPYVQTRAGEIVGEANQKLAGAIGNVGGALLDADKEIQKRQQERQAILNKSFAGKTYNTFSAEVDDKANVELVGEQDATYGATDRFQAEINKSAQTWRDTLQNDEQRIMFDDLARTKERGSRATVAKHEATETKKAFISSMNGVADSSQETFVQATDPELMADAHKAGITAIDLATAEMPSEWSKEVKARWTSETYTKRAAHIGVNAPEAALEFMQKNKDRFRTEDWDKLTKVLQADSDTAMVERAASAVFVTVFNEKGDDATVEDYTKAIDGSEIPDRLKAQVRTAVRQRNTDHGNAVKARQTKHDDKSIDFARQPGATTKGVRESMGDGWMEMSSKGRTAVENYLKAKDIPYDASAKRAMATFYDMDDETVEKMKAADLLTMYGTKVDKKHMDLIFERQTVLKDVRSGVKRSEQYTGFTLEKDVLRAARGSGMVPAVAVSKWSDNEVLRHDELQREVQYQINVLEASRDGKKKATPQEKAKIIDEVMLDTIRLNDKWGDERDSVIPAGAVIIDDIEDIYKPFKNIDEATVKVRREELLNAGRYATEEKIARLEGLYQALEAAEDNPALWRSIDAAIEVELGNKGDN